MCGISGFISTNYNHSDLSDMTKTLNHRGPNSKGHYYYKENGVGLGHTRLSIIDLSDEANQPMTSHCGRYIMVYNGEVYNYKDLAKEVNYKNWKTSSDSEILLEAFVKWGAKFVNKLNGMFAIAIYDNKENKLFLFRDRMGIKPLFYLFEENQLIFSSEIKAIKVLKKEKKINSNAIYAYLHLGYVPSNNTIYKNIYKVNPGSYIEYNNNSIKEISYWKPKNKLIANTFDDFSSSKKKLKLLLQNSIKHRLISDVPLGTFLSGGTDSSIVTAIAQEMNASPINTFSIGFDEAKFNESEYAKRVAKYLGTNHNEFILTEKDAIAELESIIENFDEPFADSSALPTMLVSKMAKKHVSVCLTGDGGDELFMGYGAYNWAKRINHPIYKNLRTSISKLLSISSNNKFKRASLVFNSPSNNWKSHIFSQEQYLFSEYEISKLLVNSNNSLIKNINKPPSLPRELNNMEKQSFFDLNNYLINDLLVKVDRASMFSSLEARVPILDHNVVEFAININSNLKFKNGTHKFILKELLYDYIPKNIMERPKWGFSIPLEKWLKTDLYFLIEKYLNKEIISNQGILNYDEIKKLKSRFENGESYLFNRIWSLLILTKFIKNLN